jgi:serine kinase of HPr protein (carbohydrate metabolism regulator)
MERIHATCVALDGQAVLLQGDSGSGKSDLALRLMDQGWDLVSDDYTELEGDGEVLLASPPETIKGLFEVRGIGLVHLPHVERDHDVAVFNLVPTSDGERLPELKTVSFEGLDVACYTLHALHASAVAKIRMALKAQSKNLFFNLET